MTLKPTLLLDLPHRQIQVVLILSLGLSHLLPQALIWPSDPWASSAHCCRGACQLGGHLDHPSMPWGRQGSAQHGKESVRAGFKVMLIATLLRRAVT